MGNNKRNVWTKDYKMIMFFLTIVFILNNIFANNQAIGFYVKNDYLGGKVTGLVFTYLFFLATLLISYKTNQNIILNTFFYIIGSIVNYFLYTLFYKIHLKRHSKSYNQNKSLFLLIHKKDLLNDIEKNIQTYNIEKDELYSLKNSNKINKRIKENLKNLLIDKYKKPLD